MRIAWLVLMAAFLTSCGTSPVEPPSDGGGSDGAPTDAGSCAADAACDDGLFCNGIERCVASRCQPAAAAACVGRTCNEATNACEGACTDADRDGACTDVDCDDTNAARYPGANERCDTLDDDCDPATLGPDQDRDTFAPLACCNPQPSGAPLCGTDCDDTRATVNPSAVESCNGGIDDDCDGLADAADGVCRPCPAGFDGFDSQCVDRDECAMDVCGLGAASCANMPAGAYTCTCRAGYVGVATGGSCMDVDECATSPCGPMATACSNTVGSYLCTCPAGYAAPATGGACAEIDECAMGLCGAGATGCMNLVGSYACTCRAGFTAAAMGMPCTDINECQTGAPCGPGVCTNTAGAYTCACNPGYTAPPMRGTCLDVNECTAMTSDCDTDPAACMNTPGAFLCNCPFGFSGTGRGADGCLRTDPSLADLTTSAGSVGFLTMTTDYTVILDVGVTTATVTATLPSPTRATVTLNGTPLTSGVASAPFATPGTATLVVTTESGATRTYTVTFVARCAPRPTGDPRWPQSRLPGTAGVPRSYQVGALTVVDCVTGLEWQRTAGPSQAQAAAISYCDSLVLAGYSDWRLPERIELFSLVDPTRTPPFLLDTTAFRGGGSTAWSATPAPTLGFAYFVDFGSGAVRANTSPNNPFTARCVR